MYQTGYVHVFIDTHYLWLLNLFLFFLAFDFCRFYVVIRFFHPPTTANNLRLPSQMLSITLFSYLNSSERASISLLNVECQTRELLVPFL